MTITLGAKPDHLTVRLTRGADFIATLTNQAGSWAEGAVVAIVLSTDPETTWTAAIAGADAVFNVDKTLADAIRQGTAAELRYTLGDIDQVWARGSVSRSD